MLCRVATACYLCRREAMGLEIGFQISYSDKSYPAPPLYAPCQLVGRFRLWLGLVYLSFSLGLGLSLVLCLPLLLESESFRLVH